MARSTTLAPAAWLAGNQGGGARRAEVEIGEARSYPVLPALRGLLPDGLPRGQAVAVDGAGALPLALVAGVFGGVAVEETAAATTAIALTTVAGDPAAGTVAEMAVADSSQTWCGVVGLAEFGALAAGAMGADLSRILLVDEPGERWPEVVATLIPAVGVVLLRPPARPPSGIVRRLMALARQHGTTLIVVGVWEGAQLRLQVTSSLWTGLGDGHGHLRGRRVHVVAGGRGTGGRARSAWLWLPAPDGTVRAADLEAVPGNQE